jgi:hypothetical protein
MTSRPLSLTALRVAVAFSIATAAAAAAQVPSLISYQGQLNDRNGVPVNATVSFVFSIYDVPAGGTALWTEAQTVPVSNGVFNVQLGAVQPLPTAVFMREALYLGIKAGADAEMTPRQRITASAYSIKSEIGVVPIGAIVAWHKSMSGTPALPAGWVECNGQTLSDAASPFNGQPLPNLNGGSRFLRGAAVSGTTGGADNHVHRWYDHGNDPGNYNRTLAWASTGDGASSYASDGSTAQNVQDMSRDHYTDSQSSLPSYFSVVWIMRVR